MYDGAVQGRPADAAARRAPRADRGVRRRGDRQADPGPGARGADRRPGRHQRRQRDRAGAVRRLADGRASAAGPRRTAGAAAACRSSTSRRSSRRCPSWPAPLHRPPATSLRRHATRRSPLAGSLRTAARSSSTCRWTSSSTPPPAPAAGGAGAGGAEPDPDALAAIAGLLAAAEPPGAGARHRRVGRRRRGGRAAPRRGRRRSRPSPTAWAAASSPAATRCWSPRPAARRSASADLVVVVGTPLDFRLGYGVFGGKDGADPGPGRARRRLPRPGLRATPSSPPPSSGDLTAVLDGLQAALERRRAGPDWSAWVDGAARRRARPPPSATRELLAAEADPIHPARIYGELVPRLADDAVVIGDGGDFVSLRRQVRRAEAARRLARPRPLRLPRRRPRRRDRRPDRPALARRWCCCSATARPASR